MSASALYPLRNEHRRSDDGVDDPTEPLEQKTPGDGSSTTRDFSSCRSLLGLTPKKRRKTRKKAKFIAGFALLWLLFALNIAGGLLFWKLEMNATPKDVFPHQECLRQTSAQLHGSAELQSGQLGAELLTSMTLRLVDDCLRNSTRMDELTKALMFSWSLYTTIGYGNFYPHTVAGQLLAAGYALFTIPLYVAVKAEFGYFLSTLVLKAANGVKRLFTAIASSLGSRRREDFDEVHRKRARDLTIVVTCAIACSLISLAFTFSFSMTEQQPLHSSFYFTVISMLLVGVGDITPTHLQTFLAIYCPFFFVGDILSSHILYFVHGKMRVLAHVVARKCLRIPRQISLVTQEAGSGQDSEDADVPHITTKCMPMNVLECERVEKETDEALVSPAYAASVTAASEGSWSRLTPSSPTSDERRRP